MSRIGRLPIEIPKGVTCTFSEQDHLVTVKGPKGELKQKIDTDFKIVLNEGNLVVERPTEQKRHKAMHGLYRSLINNMVEGVSKGFKAELELIGVGYKASAQGNVLDLSLGYSHSVILGDTR
jgi:large subunit ribosomal protein L6